MKRFKVAMTCKLNGKYAEAIMEGESVLALLGAMSKIKDMEDMSEIDITEID